ncbi:MAG: alpha/beta hydrolase [Pseudomonadales bacterium]|nr:alpha/beta hydrolase [Pseudomonadales bacterium]
MRQLYSYFIQQPDETRMKSTTTDKSFKTTQVRFPSGRVICHADFYKPLDDRPCPIIVMAHGLGGTRKMRLPAFAERFASEGYACLVFDYRHFGDSEGSPRQLLDIKKQRQDWKAAISCARQLEGIDASRMILWGTSFAGGHVLSTAAEDTKVAAVIAQCPFTNGLSSSMAMNPWTSIQLSILGACDRIGARIGFSPLMVNTAGKPGELALMNAPDVWSGYSAIAAGTNSPNYVAARFALDIIRDYPGRRAAQIKAPVFYCICDGDSVAPAKQSLRHAKKTPNKEIKVYHDGHFEIYVGEAFERVVADQLDFLRRTVPAAKSPNSVTEALQ